MKLNRRNYNAGDEIEIAMTAPYTGSGLITIESDKVYAHQWFTSSTTSSVQHIRVPEGFDGTGYVNVSFVRALDSKEIFMSPLSYAVVPFTVNKVKRATARRSARQRSRQTGRAFEDRLQNGSAGARSSSLPWTRASSR